MPCVTAQPYRRTGLAEVIWFPTDVDLAAIGERVDGEVIAHADHNHQVRIKPFPAS
ncbi:hypothetical protein [Alloactinosynnema sp. L-07]|uniref:hypothetical protein n=1 Tax=Alloactinosynnema sp. L-07 TaxID=1653480 RepID=UPI00065F0475|nr:hypothetical protein [Alloactinosynnema sp. L-07]CRK61664.1 hypothetical protein [Alloactinosynnema sp. L-07]